MLDDYKLKGDTKKIQVEVEASVLERILEMEQYTKLTTSELVNTAIKRFIAGHKDFLPPTLMSVKSPVQKPVRE